MCFCSCPIILWRWWWSWSPQRGVLLRWWKKFIATKEWFLLRYIWNKQCKRWNWFLIQDRRDHKLITPVEYRQSQQILRIVRCFFFYNFNETIPKIEPESIWLTHKRSINWCNPLLDAIRWTTPATVSITVGVRVGFSGYDADWILVILHMFSVLLWLL